MKLDTKVHYYMGADDFDIPRTLSLLILSNIVSVFNKTQKNFNPSQHAMLRNTCAANLTS